MSRDAVKGASNLPLSECEKSNVVDFFSMASVAMAQASVSAGALRLESLPICTISCKPKEPNSSNWSWQLPMATPISFSPVIADKSAP